MINVELSNIWSSVTLPDLLSREKEIFDAHLHLRNNESDRPQFLGWLGQSDSITARMIHSLRKAAQTICASCDTLVVLGCGSAYLAAKAGVELLTAQQGVPEICFSGCDLSGRQWLELCRRLEGRELCVHIIMPHGTQLQPAVASRAMRWLLERRYGIEAKKRVFISALPDTPMAQMAAEEGYTFLPIPTEPGGASSALSGAALLPIAVAGIDPLDVLEGAAEAYRQYDLRAFENPVWMYAGAKYALYRKGCTTELFGTFDPAFGAFSRWWQHSTMLHTCREGEGTLSVPVCYPEDLSMLDMMLCSGRVPLFQTLLRLPPLSTQKVNIEMDWKDYDGLGYLTGRTLSDVEEATYQAMIQTHAAQDVPIMVLEGQTLDAAHFGELLYFLELSNAIFACACGLDPFDLPALLPTFHAAAQLLKKTDT